jgi:hypothetical protein
LTRRIFPGFRIGEALAWLIFHISWPALMALIYMFTGRFQEPGFMSFEKYAGVQGVVLTSKALLFVLFWWLYFKKLNGLSLIKKLPLHLVTAPVYTGLCIAMVYFGMTRLLHMPYSRNAMLVDVYNLLFFYFSHFALFHAYNFWLSTFRQRLMEEELRNLSFQTEIKALKAQIEPHFLFNTLNSISASVPPEHEKTRMLIADLADTFRFALKATETEMVSLGEELQFIKTWLGLEKHRLKEKLNVIFEVDSKCLDVSIPPMLLQPIIENALNHGIAPKLSGGTVHIHCVRDGDYVQIAIRDTGVGYKGPLHELLEKGIGLKNTSRRLQLLYGAPLSIACNDEGLTVSFRILATNVTNAASSHTTRKIDAATPSRYQLS